MLKVNLMALPFTLPVKSALPELTDVFPGELFAVLLERDGRRAAALIGRDVEGPFARNVCGLGFKACRTEKSGREDHGGKNETDGILLHGSPP